jgi:photosystem II stability/assembly factor-like uncharacterized protein
MKKLIILLLFSFTCGINFSQNYPFTEQNSGVTTELNSSACSPTPWMTSLNVNWVCGNNGVVIRSKAFDSVWISTGQNGIPISVNLVNICAIDTMIALTAGYTGVNTYIYRTTNKGDNWALNFTQTGGYINAIYFNNQQTGFVMGNPVGGRWSLWKSTDLGVTWDSSGLYLPQNNNESSFNNCLSMRSGNICFGTDNSRIYLSTNLGQSWTAKQINMANVYAVSYLSGTIYAGGAQLYKSTNSGNNWLLINAPGTGYITGFAYLGYDLFGYYVRGNAIYRTNNSGYNWILAHTAPAGIYNYINGGVNDWYYVDIMGVRNNGGISKYYLVLGGLEKIENKIPDKYSLSQNYPNPFNPKSKIKFDIAKSGNVKLIIYDILGREITVLVNEKLKAGTYETEWDGTNYPSGVYFYKLVTAGYTETRKMVLVK